MSASAWERGLTTSLAGLSVLIGHALVGPDTEVSAADLAKMAAAVGRAFRAAASASGPAYTDAADVAVGSPAASFALIAARLASVDVTGIPGDVALGIAA